MITLLVQEGQMCNQLLSLSALMTLGIENGCDVKCPVVEKNLLKIFELNNESNINILFYHSNFSLVIKYVLKFIKKVTRCEFKKSFDYQNPTKDQIFLNWLSFIDNPSYVNNVNYVRTYFKIKPDLYNACLEKYTPIKDKSVVVGVHIRRGDYKTFRNGKWYYDDETFIRWMKSLQDSFSEPVKFVLCSNEKINVEKYKKEGLLVFNPGKNSIDDLIYLSLCDFVMGPPSSYSFWAAMYGNKKRCILDSRDKMYTWDDFLFFEDRLRAGDYIR